MHIIDWVGYGITVIVGTSCIYLTFAFSSHEYDMICGKFNAKCYQCCICCVRTVHGTQQIKRELKSKSRSLSISVLSMKLSRTAPTFPGVCRSNSDIDQSETANSIKVVANGKLETQDRNRVESYSDFPSSLKTDGIVNSHLSDQDNDIQDKGNNPATEQKSVETSLNDHCDLTDLSPIQEESTNKCICTGKESHIQIKPVIELCALPLPLPLPDGHADITPVSVGVDDDARDLMTLASGEQKEINDVDQIMSMGTNGLDDVAVV